MILAHQAPIVKVSPERGQDQMAVWVKDLQKLKTALPVIDDIAIRGGAVVDVLLGLEPLDIDIFYNTSNDKLARECYCEVVKSKVTELGLFKGYEGRIDVENSQEKEPGLDPVTRTCGFFSYHTDYVSMFALSADGNLYAHQAGWMQLNQRVYETRAQGNLMWLACPKPSDSQTLYGMLLCDIIRAIGYTTRRNLKLAPHISELVFQWRFLLDRMQVDKVDLERSRHYAAKKISPEQVEDFQRRFGKELRLGSDFTKVFCNGLNLK